jgi:hypothetical protein
MAKYEMLRFSGIEKPGEPVTELFAHMVRVVDENAVELFTLTEPAILSREQFQQLAAWVNEQFDQLGKESATTVH